MEWYHAIVVQQSFLITLVPSLSKLWRDTTQQGIYTWCIAWYGLVFENCELGVVTPIFWGIFIKYVYTVGESIPFFPILDSVNILKFSVVKEIIQIRKNFRDRLYTIVNMKKHKRDRTKHADVMEASFTLYYHLSTELQICELKNTYL